ncbi:major facilitator superfamily MFS_1 [Calothrix parasitica NIES-267]|uniref:Major facilitator superfamily MFS_1 n=1 Tax=Calothrix parasitica NIES-267 TaxID=1973488 RepID=A0A1Z4LY69_9CYAN|nr:major facilitator superfamily MFS_1 [Calothrix parasitica NIES-267]
MRFLCLGMWRRLYRIGTLNNYSGFHLDRIQIDLTPFPLETAGTDYTMQNSIVYFGGIFTVAMSGILAKAIGYPGVFAISIMISIIGLLLIVKVYKETNHPQIET